MFTRIVWSLQVDPKLVFMWLYQHVRDEVVSRKLDFQDTIMHTFGHHKLVDLLGLVRDKKVTTFNAKKIMRKVIEGDERMPNEIAESLGFTGEISQSEELVALVKKNVE